MGRRHKSKRYDLKRTDPFIAFDWAIINSSEYKALTFAARSALIVFIGKAAIAEQKKEPTFKFPYSEAVRLGFSRKCFSRAIKQLIEKRFIEIAEHGGLRGAGGSCSTFKTAVTRYWKSQSQSAEKAQVPLKATFD